MRAIRPRDENGWRVPREGSFWRQLYDMMKAGKSRAEICAAFPHKERRHLDAIMRQIRRPSVTNKARARQYWRQRGVDIPAPARAPKPPAHLFEPLAVAPPRKASLPEIMAVLARNIHKP